MSNKNQVSKKTRFEVFKRDDFTCQYCGKTPPEVILEVDHINPKSKGGTGDINNLITACFDCNRGKGKILLEKVPNTIKDNYEILKEKELQLIEYNKLLKKIKQRQNKELQSINEIYTENFPKYALNSKFLNVSVKKFIKELGLREVEDSMQIACSKINCSDKVIPYFCGICWSRIKQKNPIYSINLMWENFSKAYRKGTYDIKKDDIEKIKHIPLNIIKDYIRISLTSGEQYSYWKYFLERLKSGGYLK